MRAIDADALSGKIFCDADMTNQFTCHDSIQQIIKDAPTIERKMGEWIADPKIGWGETWVCSICGEKTVSSIMGKPRYEFCPMCGADMRGEPK